MGFIYQIPREVKRRFVRRHIHIYQAVRQAHWLAGIQQHRQHRQLHQPRQHSSSLRCSCLISLSSLYK
ncbi:hypothetical protein P175DRAFT_0314776 [Aspergillus ochraceoroseus IBT 24754]|uniref:Uncharacterized protein n=1 Tax=Aspergillus ochraceoroseus IBT 24754 TaxID=1392256 RepID=A0A2T5LQE9_9EURO|nr:uncharacterized protein P175DRAFT_0314776 [Aspergillus ochraceoroseus IBT 24754]PTU18503.1 hypothetical protein P175DRAFT_0314776 [Aspergillus ochraceoroseus IBT 24754]